jgi:transposase
MRKELYYIGMDVHKRTISYCVKSANGAVLDEGVIPSTRTSVKGMVHKWVFPWIGGMEATMFTWWIYDELVKSGQAVKVADPYMLKAIVASKKKSDRLDARTLADLLRCDLFPEVYIAERGIRDLRKVLRFRNLVVHTAVKMKNKTASLLMETGQEYNKSRLHGKRYFNELLDRLEDVPDYVMELLRLSHSGVEIFDGWQRHLIKELRESLEIKQRVERLMSIPGVGEVTALTWVLEVADPHRFSAVRKAVSYCGLCSAYAESAGKIRRGPLSKQRNSNLQTVLIEAAKLAPRYNPQLKEVYSREAARGNRNDATLAVARKLVAYMLAVDKSGREFEVRDDAPVGRGVRHK